MKRTVIKCLVTLCCMAFTMPTMAQFNLKKAINSAAKATKAVTLTDEEMKEYVKEYIDWMDEHNQVCADDKNMPSGLKN